MTVINRQRPRTIMVGTGFFDKGGIATVVNGYRNARLFDDGYVRYVRSHTSDGNLAKFFLAISAYFRVLWLLIVWNARVCHVHVSSRFSFWRKLPIFLLTRAMARKSVLHLHSGEFMIFYNEECRAWQKRIIRSVFETVSVVLVLSPEWKIKISGIAPNAHIDVLTNGIPVPENLPDYKPDSRRKIILFLGLLSRRKGIYDLLSVVERLRTQVPEVLLIAAGDGEVDELRARVDETGMSDCVEIPGWIDSQRKFELLNRASVFVLPSYNEGLPMSLLEAMAAAVPVVATLVGGIPTAVVDGRDGLLVEAGDNEALHSALLTVLRDPAKARALAESGYQRVSNEFSVEHKVEYLGELYCRLAGE